MEVEKTIIQNNERLKFASETITSKTIDRKFGKPEDYIEVHILNELNQILTSIPNFNNYQIPSNNTLSEELIFDPVSILNNNGYTSGKYILIFNILRKKIFNTSDKIFTIKEISPSRRELRIVVKDISNEELKISSQRFINEIDNSPFLRDFILNFGNNQIFTGINIAYNEIPVVNEILIKLSEPLPNNIPTSLLQED
jgi:hypothetical protein